ncbi:MAG: zinc ABC transporter substrate-binding protein [Thermomicrobiales bacterium]|nr:zinc ABC transporter substrate-binding protein [Thermomicrobiales bacterium]
MSPRFTRRYLFGAIGTSAVLASSLRIPAGAQSDGLAITTTIGMIADAVRNIGGDHVNVTSLMGPGVDPHLYKPSAGDIAKLESADAIFYGGLHLEGRMVDVLEQLLDRGAAGAAVLETLDSDQLIETDGAPDPHVWFDVALWGEALASIPTVLSELDTSNTSTYEDNWASYKSTLTELDTYAEEQIGTIPEEQRVLVTAHDAFNYFGRRYGMEVRGIQGMSTASEAGAKDIQELADFLSERQIKAIFVESSVPHDTIEALQKACESRGWPVAVGGELFSDAMGDEGTPEGTYVGMVRHNVDTIVAALA